MLTVGASGLKQASLPTFYRGNDNPPPGFAQGNKSCFSPPDAPFYGNLKSLTFYYLTVENEHINALLRRDKDALKTFVQRLEEVTGESLNPATIDRYVREYKRLWGVIYVEQGGERR